MLSKSTEYAIRALVYIRLQNNLKRKPGVTEVTTEIDAPEHFTAKILQVLTRHGLLRSMKGRGGGFFFDDSGTDVTLFDVIRLMEGEGYFTKCGFGLKSCNAANPCPLHHQYAAIRDGFSHLVRKETIGSLALKIESGEAFLKTMYS